MEKEKGRNKKVMVAIDESESSYYALIWVLGNLKEMIINTPLVIFYAQPLPKSKNYAYAGHLGFARLYCPISPTLDMISIVQEQNKKVALGILEKAKKICASQGVKVETITEAGEPGELICNAVQNYKVNLLVVGNDEIGAFERAFLGSVTSYCLNNAKCPVVVVKKPE